MLKKYTFILTLTLLFIGCQKNTNIKNQNNIPLYSGYYFDAMINDSNVIELKNSSNISTLKSYVRTVRWQLDKPISGEFSVKYSKNKNTRYFIGNILRREAIDIISLQNISVKTNSQLQSDSSVQINGAASIGQVDVLNKNILPSGEYIFRLKIHGTKNWDRKEIYVKVK